MSQNLTHASGVETAKPSVPAKVGPLPGRKLGKSKVLLPRLVAIAIAFVLWQLFATGSLPSPLEVGQAMARLWATPDYWIAIGQTLRAWAIGLLICCVVGIPVGLILGSSLAATRSTTWIIDFFRTIPTIALLPLVLLLLGASMEMQLTMIVTAAIWPMIIQSMYAVKQIEPLQKWVVRTFRVGRLDRARFLWAPSVSLLVATGMRLAATMSLLMALSAEYLGGAPGIGSQLSRMEDALRRPEVFAYTVTAGVLGLLINQTIMGLQRRVLWWHPSIRGEHSS